MSRLIYVHSEVHNVAAASVSLSFFLCLSLSPLWETEQTAADREAAWGSTHSKHHITYEMLTVHNRGVFMPPFFSHPYAQQEFIHSLKKHTTRQKGRGSSTPWALYVHIPVCVCVCVCVCVYVREDTHEHRSLHFRRTLGSTGTFSGTWSSLLYDMLSDSLPCTDKMRHSEKDMPIDGYTQCMYRSVILYMNMWSGCREWIVYM